MRCVDLRSGSRIEIFLYESCKFHSYFHIVCTIVNNVVMSGAFFILGKKKNNNNSNRTCGFRRSTVPETLSLVSEKREKLIKRPFEDYCV